MKRSFRAWKVWFVIWLLAIMSAAAFVIGPIQVIRGSEYPAMSADCLHREQAGERHLAITWFAVDAAPVVTAATEFSLIKTALVGTLRCGATGERIVEWTWGKADPQPTVVWYELSPIK